MQDAGLEEQSRALMRALKQEVKRQSILARLILYPLGAAVLASIVNALRLHALANIINHTMWSALPVGALVWYLIRLALKHRTNEELFGRPRDATPLPIGKPPPRSVAIAVEFTVSAVTGLVVAAVLNCVALTAMDVALLAVEAPLIVRSALVLLAGALLFAFKFYLRPYYGMTEVIAGVFLGSLKASEELSRHQQNWANWQVLLGFLSAGVYLVVRGIDNIQQGFAAKAPDRITAWLNKHLGRAIIPQIVTAPLPEWLKPPT